MDSVIKMNSYTNDWNYLYKYICCILVLFLFLKSMSNCFTSNKHYRNKNKAFRVSGDF